MHEVATINFRDPVNDSDGFAIVRATAGQIGLCLSIKSDGDVEAFFSLQDAETLIAALRRAATDASAAQQAPQT